MARCASRDADGSHCENEALSDLIYCNQHAHFESDVNAKIEHLYQALDAKTPQGKQKDIWDVLSSTGTIISGVLIGGIGLYATSSYNDRQLELQQNTQIQNTELKRMEIIQKFFPNLYSDSEEQRTAALVAIEAIGDEEFVAKLVEKISSVEALSKLSSSTNAAVAEQATRSLKKEIATELYKKTVFQIKAELDESLYGPNASILGTGFVASKDGYAITVPDIVSQKTMDAGKKIEVRFQAAFQVPFEGEVIHVDERANLSVVQFDSKKIEGLPLADTMPNSGEPVKVVGFLSSGELAYLEQAGVIEAQNEDGHFIISNVVANSGLAGAPILDANGLVFGHVIGTDREGKVLGMKFEDLPPYLKAP